MGGACEDRIKIDEREVKNVPSSTISLKEFLFMIDLPILIIVIISHTNP